MYREILVVDDSATLRNLAQIMFRGKPGVVVHLAATGLEAGQVLLANPKVEAVLLDVNMPGESGLQVLEGIRKLGGRFEKIPILMMSADDRDKTIVQAMRIGATGYIKKPFSLTKVTELFERVQARQAGRRAVA